jgi:uncharacterized membrane protein YgcG
MNRAMLLSEFAASIVLATAAAPALAQSMVLDQTGSLPQITLTQIDDRNGALQTKTGTSIAVLIEHGTTDESEQDAQTTAQNALGQKFGVLVWIQTGFSRGDLIFSNAVAKWIPPDEQDALTAQVQNAAATCCLSDSLPHVIDTIASAMEAGSAAPPDPQHYIFDQIGLLDAAHVARIVAREKQLESGTGKGVGVILIQPQPDESPSAVA